MEIVDTLCDLVTHMEWADLEVWSAVHALNDESDQRLLRLLNHLHMTQRAFIDVWTAKPFDLGFFKDRSLAEIEELARGAHRDARQFMSTVDAASLDRETRLPWAERFSTGANATTLGDTILQITAHSTYHRGQANMRIRELGGEPPLVDFIAWIWKTRPQPHAS